MTLARLGSSRMAAFHYRASLKTITRWRREQGLPPHSLARGTPSTGRLGRARFGMGPKPIVIHRDFSTAGRAADFLQRFGPVFRCLPSGKAHRNGLQWNRNGYVLSDAEIIERATRLGWAPAER